MGRSPCCDESGLKKGPWTPEEDDKLINYIQQHGHGSWRALPKLAGMYLNIHSYALRMCLSIFKFVTLAKTFVSLSIEGLNRCGKSCRLRWTNYLRPDIKRGKFTQEEEQTILNLHSILGNKWVLLLIFLMAKAKSQSPPPMGGISSLLTTTFWTEVIYLVL